MATSGSKSVTVTSWDTLKFSWWENSQSVENNTTTIGWKMELIAGSDGRISSSASKSWSVTVNGTNYSGTNTIGISNNSTKTLASGTTTISHNADGTKTFSYSFAQYFGITFSGSNIGTISGSGSGTLDTIARASQPSCKTYPNNTQNVGDFGTTITIHMNRKSSSFTHTVRFAFGSKSGTIATGVTDNTAWTIPLSLMEEIKNATSGIGTIYADTYNGSTKIGTKSCPFTATVPASVKPSCAISVTDADGYFSTYGKYVKGRSKFKITITPTLAYGSPIVSYNSAANGVNYSAANFTTGVLTSSGTLTITATVTDQRGRSGTATITVNAYDYSVPQITLLKVKRCVSVTDGTEDINGEFAEVTFSTQITALDNKNSAKYTLQYKKTTENEDAYSSVVLTDFSNNYNVQNGIYRFAADSGSSYNIRLIATDNFEAIPKPVPLSTGAVMEHWRADGDGMGFGKIGEVKGGADFGWAIKANKGFIPIPIVENTDLNDLKTPNLYYCKDGGNATYKNSPIASGTITFTLEVVQGGNNGFTQILTTTSKDGVTIFQRAHYSGAWGDWNTIYVNDGKVLWSGALLMTDTETITLSEQVKHQATGIVLVFSAYNGEEKTSQNFDFQDIFVSKYSVATHSMNVRSFVLGSVGFWQVGCKALSISNGQIFGDYRNDDAGTQNGITYNNKGYCLRYVIGV